MVAGGRRPRTLDQQVFRVQGMTTRWFARGVRVDPERPIGKRETTLQRKSRLPISIAQAIEFFADDAAGGDGVYGQDQHVAGSRPLEQVDDAVGFVTMENQRVFGDAAFE